MKIVTYRGFVKEHCDDHFLIAINAFDKNVEINKNDDCYIIKTTMGLEDLSSLTSVKYVEEISINEECHIINSYPVTMSNRKIPFKISKESKDDIKSLSEEIKTGYRMAGKMFYSYFSLPLICADGNKT